MLYTQLCPWRKILYCIITTVSALQLLQDNYFRKERTPPHPLNSYTGTNWTQERLWKEPLSLIVHTNKTGVRQWHHHQFSVILTEVKHQLPSRGVGNTGRARKQSIQSSPGYVQVPRQALLQNCLYVAWMQTQWASHTSKLPQSVLKYSIHRAYPLLTHVKWGGSDLCKERMRSTLPWYFHLACNSAFLWNLQAVSKINKPSHNTNLSLQLDHQSNTGE